MEKLSDPGGDVYVMLDFKLADTNTADFATNYMSRVTQSATNADHSDRLIALELYTNRADLALASNAAASNLVQSRPISSNAGAAPAQPEAAQPAQPAAQPAAPAQPEAAQPATTLPAASPP
jgi:hypothetical protein